MTNWREVLDTVLVDGRISRAERKALRALIASEARTDAQRLELRALAFEVARERVTSVGAPGVLNWLEEIVRVIDPPVAPPARAVTNEAWFSPGPGPLKCIQQQIRMTRRAMDICVFTITDDRIVASLKEAVGRGVRLRIVSDDDKSNDLGSDMERLARSGADVRLDRSPDHMHHKFGIFDGVRLLTGSYNWTRSAARGNSENVLVTSEPSLVAAYANEFERVWARAAAI